MIWSPTQRPVVTRRTCGWLFGLALALCLQSGLGSGVRADSTPTESGPDPAPQLFHLTTWTSRQGLPEDWIECITQTRDGYLWLGTPNGLIRFDRVSFLHLKRENCPALHSTVCKALLEDHEGNLWVATKNGLLCFSQHGVQRWSAENGLGGQETSSLSLGPDGTVWVGTENGVSALRGGRVQHFPARSHRSPFVYSVLADAEGRIWAGMWTGLYQLEPRRGEYSQAWGTRPPQSESAQDHVRTFLRARTGGFWFGTDAGVGRCHLGEPKVLAFGDNGTANRVKWLLEDQRGDLWAVIGYAPHRRQGDDFIPMDDPLGLTDAIVNVIYEDRQGNLWIGSRHGGLTRAKPVPGRVFTRKDGLWNNGVRSVSPRRKGGVWLATAEGFGSFANGRFKRELPDQRWAGQGLGAVTEDPRADPGSRPSTSAYSRPAFSPNQTPPFPGPRSRFPPRLATQPLSTDKATSGPASPMAS